MALTRAALAYEANEPEQFRQHYRRAQGLFADAMTLGPENVGVFAVTGGTQVTLADRLPADARQVGWELGYTAYRQLWKMQGQVIENLPLHHKGEDTFPAWRRPLTGPDAATSNHIEMLPDTPYATRARQWKDDPSGRAKKRDSTARDAGGAARDLEIADAVLQILLRRAAKTDPTVALRAE